MRALAFFLLLAVAPHAAASPPPRLPRPVRVYDLATLTHAVALRLAGLPALYRIERDSLAEEYDGRTVIDCVTADDVHRSAWLPPLAEVPDTLTVRARLRILRHPASNGFPEVLEYRLEGAVPLPSETLHIMLMM